MRIHEMRINVENCFIVTLLYTSTVVDRPEILRTIVVDEPEMPRPTDQLGSCQTVCLRHIKAGRVLAAVQFESA